MAAPTDRRLMLLHEKDNIFVCREKIKAGESIRVDGERWVVDVDIDLGHKIARRKVYVGEKIYKYGVAVGSAIADIPAAGYVHMHNMKSDYIAGHTRAGKYG